LVVGGWLWIVAIGSEGWATALSSLASLEAAAATCCPPDHGSSPLCHRIWLGASPSPGCHLCPPGLSASSAALATVLQQLPVRCLARSRSAGSSCPRPPPRSRQPSRLRPLTGVGEEAPHHAAASIAWIYCHGGGWVEAAPPRCYEISLMGKMLVAPPSAVVEEIAMEALPPSAVGAAVRWGFGGRR
ncbi:hypothetical protein ACLOJK_000355, partial [Asimina triloba]